MDFIDQLRPLIDWLNVHPGWAGIFTFLISIAESLAVVGLLVPGSVMMTAIGTLIGAGVIPGWQITAWAIAGAIAGDSLSYRLGYHFADNIREIWPFSRYPQILTKGESFFHKHGGKSVFLARFVGPMRPIVPVVAGMMKFSPTRFLISNVTSAFIWAPFYMLPGMLIGAATLELDPKTATHLILVVLAVLVLFWITAWLFKRLFFGFLSLLDRLLDQLWIYLKSKRYLRIITTLLQDPRHPDYHGQLTLALTFILTLVAFCALTLCVYYYGHFTELNNYAYHFVQSFDNPAFKTFCIIFTDAGSSETAGIITLVCMGYFFWQKRWRAGLHLFATMALVILFVGLFKQLLVSPRPDGLLNPLTFSSFPSGHTTSSIAVYGFLAVLIARDMAELGRRITYGLYTLFAVSIIITRLYLGAHWLTDIVGGILLGLTIVIGVTISYRRVDEVKLPYQGVIITLVATMLITVGVQLLLFYNQMVKQYTVKTPTITVQTKQWWQHSTNILPNYRNDRFGKPIQPFNIEWVGNLNSIKAQLIQQGWKEVPKLTLISAINRLSAQGSDRLLPIIPPLNAGHQPELMLVKEISNNKNVSLLISFWPSNITLIGSDEPLWFGTLNYQIPKGYQVWRTKRIKKLINGYKPAITYLNTELNNYCTKPLQTPAIATSNPATTNKVEEVILIFPKKNVKDCNQLFSSNLP